jgi:hypothetical protein
LEVADEKDRDITGDIEDEISRKQHWIIFT